MWWMEYELKVSMTLLWYGYPIQYLKLYYVWLEDRLWQKAVCAIRVAPATLWLSRRPNSSAHITRSAPD